MRWRPSEAADQAQSRLLAAAARAGHSFQRRPADPRDRPVAGEEPAELQDVCGTLGQRG